MSVNYSTVENYKIRAKNLGISLEEYLLIVIIEKLDEVKQAIHWTR